MRSPIVLINVFEVPSGTEHEFIAWWKKSSEALMREPGFITAKLHRSLKAEARFQFVNVAHWETEEALNLARSRNEGPLRSLAAGHGIPSVYEVIVQY